MADWYFRNHQGSLQSCPGCRNLVKTTEEFCPYCARRLRAEGGVHGLMKKLRAMPEPATRLLLGLVGLAFILQIAADMVLPAQFRLAQGGSGSILPGTADPLTYFRLGSNFHPFILVYGEVWRFLTYCFLHFGIIHIGFNSWAFWDLGRLAERLWGSRQVFAVFILTGIAGGMASFGLAYMTGRMANSAGASGAVCGVLGLLLGAYYRNRYHVGEHLGSQLVRWAVFIIAFGLFAGADNAAHIGGMLGGGLFGYFMPPTRTTRTLQRDTKIWNAAAALALALLVLCVGCAVYYYAQGPLYAYMKL